ncbi:hypothetical protein N3K66_002483 [Trichothecium roseum]|uniref:Uncharacterized protein n=1 Tax=Trichothecium roseum TaxID=47278 RepID=A0ACC0V9H1_9HYPO|nr:hypothetical protein N3K66_002483 [Trichothecium roseum]
MLDTVNSLSNTGYAFGALVASGGVMGYVKGRSVPSIVAGVTVGSLYGFGGYRIQNRQEYGIELGILASAVLGASSIPRAIKSGKPVPSMLGVVSLLGLIIFGRGYANGPILL